MADDKKVTPARTATHKAAQPRALAPAAESSDPAVHQLLAALQTARSNGNDDEVNVVTRKLADLGFE